MLVLMKYFAHDVRVSKLSRQARQGPTIRYTAQDISTVGR